MKYYLLQTLLVAPLTAALLVAAYWLPLPIPYVGDVLMVLPSIMCCTIHLWVKKARLLSLGTLYTCILLPQLTATLYCIYACYLSPGESMIGLLYLVMWLANFMAAAFLLALTAMGRIVNGKSV